VFQVFQVFKDLLVTTPLFPVPQVLLDLQACRVILDLPGPLAQLVLRVFKVLLAPLAQPAFKVTKVTLDQLVSKAITDLLDQLGLKVLKVFKVM
jgi:hypothetical protein